jgi:hypothetical protein
MALTPLRSVHAVNRIGDLLDHDQPNSSFKG